jgi:tetratricopeptide (TPR) repeat protein
MADRGSIGYSSEANLPLSGSLRMTSTAPAVNRAVPWNVVAPPGPLEDVELIFELLPEGVERDDDQDEFRCRLWTTVVAVRLWARTPVRQRASLFARRRANRTSPLASIPGCPAELRPAFETFDSMYARPEEILRKALHSACTTVAGWAELNGFPITAAHYAETSARLAYVDPHTANFAARICRRAGLMNQAEIWYQRAIGLSRAGKNAEAYISGQLGSAAILLERCQYGEAERRLRAAARMAREAGHKRKAAEAFHDTFMLAALAEDVGRAMFFARRAFATYPRKSERFPAFAYDVAVLLVRSGLYAVAYRILKTSVRKLVLPHEQLIAWGTLARAAAGTGDRAAFIKAVQQVDELGSRHRASAAAADYMVAEGARLLEDWPMAEAYVERALVHAKATGSEQILDLASATQHAVLNRLPGRGELPASAAEGPALRALGLAVHERLIRWRHLDRSAPSDPLPNG